MELELKRDYKLDYGERRIYCNGAVRRRVKKKQIKMFTKLQVEQQSIIPHTHTTKLSNR